MQQHRYIQQCNLFRFVDLVAFDWDTVLLEVVLERKAFSRDEGLHVMLRASHVTHHTSHITH